MAHNPLSKTKIQDKIKCKLGKLLENDLGMKCSVQQLYNISISPNKWQCYLGRSMQRHRSYFEAANKYGHCGLSTTTSTPAFSINGFLIEVPFSVFGSWLFKTLCFSASWWGICSVSCFTIHSIAKFSCFWLLFVLRYNCFALTELWPVLLGYNLDSNCVCMCVCSITFACSIIFECSYFCDCLSNIFHYLFLCVLFCVISSPWTFIIPL